MKKLALVLALVFFVGFTGTVMAQQAPGPFDNTLSANSPGPAPNSHDGIPDGPGWPEDPGFFFGGD